MPQELTQPLETLQWACPQCGAELETRGDTLGCSGCRREYSIARGIPNFRNAEASFQWGVNQRQIWDMLRGVGEDWPSAYFRLIDALPANDAQLLWLRSMGLRRAALMMLLGLNKNARVLDFGCGFGAISLALAPWCGEVIAMDQLPLHLEWTGALARHLNIPNIRLALAGDTPFLPFTANSLDAVVLNGVLEHVATNSEGDPQEIQQRVLADIRRVLKPKGRLYVGIENRINYKYFLGVREGHINMKYGALLPRWATRLWLQTTRQQPFREYTYTLWGYRKLLARAGFKHVRFFAPWPTYSSAGNFYPVDETRRTPLWHVESRHPAARPPGAYFARAYSMTASLESPPGSLMEDVLLAASRASGEPLPWTLRESLFTPTAGGKAFLRATTQRGASFRIQVGLTSVAGERIRRQAESLEHLHQRGLDPNVLSQLPPPGKLCEVQGHTVCIRPYASGVGGKALAADAASRESLASQALDFLIRLHAAGRRVEMNASLFETQISAPLLGLRDWFSAGEWAGEYERWVRKAEIWLRSSLMGQSLLLVPFHGDFVPDNCLWDPAEHRLRQVLDWELYQSEGLPLVDWACFLGDCYRDAIKRQLRAAGHDPERMRFHGHPQVFLNGMLAEKADLYLRRLDLDSKLKSPLLFMWWVRQMTDWRPLHQFNPEWRRLRLFSMIERWNAAWDAESRGQA